MNTTIKTTILFLTSILVVIGMGSGFTNLAAVPHQLPSSSKRVTSEKSAIVSFELDNPLIETDEGIVPARKCAVCIGVSCAFV